MRKLLIQAYKFPPIQAVGVQRIFQLYYHMLPSFDQIHVQTSNNRGLFAADPYYTGRSYIPPVVEIPTRDLRTRLAQRGQAQPFLNKADRAAAFYRRLSPLYHAYPFVLFTGDGGYTYMRESVKHASQLIEREGITHILSSYRPWADHLVAYRLKRRFPHLIWIADFRDLPVDPVRKDAWWPGLQARFQRRLLQRAAIVTTVSNGLAKRLRKDHNQVLVLRNGLPELPNGFLTAPQSPHFKITYTGSLYAGLQSADPLLRCLRELIDAGELNPAHLELHYAGKDGELWQQWLQQYNLRYLNVDHGLVSIAQAAELQRNSQLNLLLSWSATNYGGIMTAKLGHYLAAGRPIITLLNGPDDPELTEVVEGTGAGFVFPSQQADCTARLRSFLLDAYRTWSFSGALPWRIDPQQLQAYTWSYQLQQLLDQLSSDIQSS